MAPKEGTVFVVDDDHGHARTLQQCSSTKLEPAQRQRNRKDDVAIPRLCALLANIDECNLRFFTDTSSEFIGIDSSKAGLNESWDWSIHHFCLYMEIVDLTAAAL